MLDTDRYAGKKRKKPVQKQKPVIDATKSNPSKRHRDRLNGELDRLTHMLPFPEDVRARLDKLSVLRLSVGYLKVKSFFNATMKKSSLEFPTGNCLDLNELDAMGLSEGDLLLQALNGFVLVVTAEGYVFYASPTIQDYLGFHQSDMVHQSVFEFIHVDDRAMFRRQLHFALNPKLSDQDKDPDGLQSSSDITRDIVIYDPQHIPPENSSFLDRGFVCRFRCLLDNSSGFLKLNFQGRLKFLHGQNKKAEDGSLVQPQLALFAIATPVQPPAILEIRTKTLIFQTKHKLDFTPLGIDSRGKVVLGYSEIELCMRGSGYQFIHAADMMHCADNHVRMIKTGESGMTVFRLLTKNGGWIWVQANARLVYKGGRPEFIIARQRALVNAEGEEHLRQRSLQLPFSLTTGEAVLYDTAPSPPDMMSPESNVMEHPPTDQKPSDPSSILVSMQKQEKTVYHQPAEPEFSVDSVFKDSWALFNVPSHAVPDESVKEEEDTVMAMIDVLEQLAQDGDLCTALQQMEVDSTKLKEWESAVLRMAKKNSSNERGLTLDEILTNDIFSYVEDALNMEMNKDLPPQQNPARVAKPSNSIEGQYPATGCGFSIGHSFDSRVAAKPELNQLSFGGIAQQDMLSAPQSTQRLSHSGPSETTGRIVPGNQENAALQDFLNNFSQTGLFTFGRKDSELFSQTQKHLTPSPPGVPNSWHPPQTLQNGRDKTKMQGSPLSSCQFGSYPVNPTGSPQICHLQNGFYQSGQPTANHWIPSTSLSPCKNHIPSSDAQNLPKFPQQSYTQPTQQWQQALPEQPCPVPVKNRLVPESYQNLEMPGYPLAQLLPVTSPSSADECKNIINDPYSSPGNRPAANHCSPLSSCMFENPSPLTNADQLHPQVQAVTIASCFKKTIPNNQSPPQASCYFQMMQSEPVVGTSSIPQEDACISPPSCHMVSGVDPTNGQSVYQQYNGCNGQTQVESHPVEYSSSFSIPPLVNGMYVSENGQANCCNL